MPVYKRSHRPVSRMPYRTRKGAPHEKQVQRARTPSHPRPMASWNLSDDDDNFIPSKTRPVGMVMLGVPLDKTKMYRLDGRERVYYKDGESLHDYVHYDSLDGKKKYELKRLANNIKILLHIEYQKQKQVFKNLSSLFGSKTEEVLDELDSQIQKIRAKVFAIRKGASGYQEAKYKDIREARGHLPNTVSEADISEWKNAVEQVLAHLKSSDLQTRYSLMRSKFDSALGLMHWLSHSKKFIYRSMEMAVHRTTSNSDSIDKAKKIGERVMMHRKDLEKIYAILRPEERNRKQTSRSEKENTRAPANRPRSSGG